MLCIVLKCTVRIADFICYENIAIPLYIFFLGSDLYDYQNLGLLKQKQLLNRVDYLITDCQRDFNIAKNSGVYHIF
jgi:hypothetical protein